MDLALVGLVAPGIENLSLAALELAARRAGYETRVVPWHGFLGLDRAVARVLALGPRVCGVSIQTSEAILAAMCLTRILRGRGFTGRIVCGGHFATLHARDILELDAGVDAVVRFAGEDALVALLQRRPPETIPGLVFRDARGAVHDGAPAKAVPALPSAAVSDRALPTHLGFPAADLVASRGCESDCGYCCVAGASRAMIAEARRAGAAEPRSARYARASLGALADEIARLSRENGARVVTFMDDNVLPASPSEVARWARELRGALDARGAPALAFALQLRADAVDEESAGALAALGLARAYVGVDGWSSEQLRSLGRKADASAAPRALEALRARNILAVCNALVLGPTTTLDSIERETDALSRVHAAPVHLLPIEVRQGSTLFDRAQRRGLVEGTFLHRAYRFLDPRAARVGRVLFALPTRLRLRSVPIAMYDLGYNLGIALRLLPEIDASRWLADWDRIASAWNADQVRILRAAVAAARESDAACDALVGRERQRVTSRDRGWIAECDRIELEIARAVSAARGVRSRPHARGRALGAVAFAMSLSACAAPSEAARDGGSDAGELALDAAADAPSDALLDAPSCADPDREPEWGASHFCSDSTGSGPTVRAHVGENGEVTAFDAIDADGGVATIPVEVRECLEAFFAERCFPSHAGTDVTFEPHYWIA